jgi:hypothetical protein
MLNCFFRIDAVSIPSSLPLMMISINTRSGLDDSTSFNACSPVSHEATTTYPWLSSVSFRQSTPSGESSTISIEAFGICDFLNSLSYSHHEGGILRLHPKKFHLSQPNRGINDCHFNSKHTPYPKALVIQNERRPTCVRNLDRNIYFFGAQSCRQHNRHPHKQGKPQGKPRGSYIVGLKCPSKNSHSLRLVDHLQRRLFNLRYVVGNFVDVVGHKSFRFVFAELCR